jgi:hypothetical protein
MTKKPTAEDDESYTGILAKPLPKRSIFDRPEEVDADLDEKLKALFDHYGVDPKKETAWMNLALKLARRHVPGFRGPTKSVGTPPIRKQDDVTLFMHVELLRRRDGFSDRQAIKAIVAKKVVEGTEGTLLRRYKRAKAKPEFNVIHEFFGTIEDGVGKHEFVKMMERSLAGDRSDSILSPG